jgi:ribonucleoside-diphosphate reductase beta chain
MSLSNLQNQELLLSSNIHRHVIFPIQYPQLWKKYKDAVSTFWTAEEIDLTKDRNDWEALTTNERHFIKNVLAFFAGSDGIVMENLAERFMREVQIPEARSFYAYQIFSEGVHSETYSLLIDTYVLDEEEKTHLLRAIQTIPCVRQKAEWAMRWIEDGNASFAKRLIAFATVEGIFFSGSFCAIYWLKSRGKMPGLTFSNELISRDEGMHTDFAIMLYQMISARLTEQEVHQLIREAVAIEKEFITESIPCNLIGMNAELMKEYIEFVADRLVVQLGYNKIWNTANPFSFMELISVRPKSNFFEVRVGEYKRAASTAGSAETKQFNISDDF